MDERVCALVEQDSVHTAVGGVERIHCYCAQAPAVSECTVPDIGNAVGDGNVGQAGAGKRAAVDAGNRQAIDRVRNDHGSAGAGVSHDCDRAVIGHVSELGLHHGGQRQKKQQQQPRGINGSQTASPRGETGCARNRGVYFHNG